MKNRIVVIDGGYESYEQEKQLLQDAGYELDIFQGERHDRDSKKSFIDNAVGMFVRWTSVDKEFLYGLDHLKAIVRYGVGYDNIDLDAATHHSISVANVQGYANHSVSDHALALMFSCLRALKSHERRLSKDFGKPQRKDMFELYNKTLGIIGLGRIGSTLAKKARVLFKEVIAVDPYVDLQRFDQVGVKKVDFATCLDKSHVISIHCNLHDETFHLLNEHAFESMSQRPVLINTARGPIIDENALLKALQKDYLHSAGLDVFEDEPPLSHRNILLSHPRIVCTGHVAWYSLEASQDLQKRAAQNMVMMLNGKIPDDCLNPIVKER